MILFYYVIFTYLYYSNIYFKLHQLLTFIDYYYLVIEIHYSKQ